MADNTKIETATDKSVAVSLSEADRKRLLDSCTTEIVRLQGEEAIAQSRVKQAQAAITEAKLTLAAAQRLCDAAKAETKK